MREAAGEAFDLLKGPRPVNGFQAEAQSLAQIGEELIGSELLSQQHAENLNAGNVRETEDLGAVGQESSDGLTFAVVQVEANQQA